MQGAPGKPKSSLKLRSQKYRLIESQTVPVSGKRDLRLKTKQKPGPIGSAGKGCNYERRKSKTAQKILRRTAAKILYSREDITMEYDHCRLFDDFDGVYTAMVVGNRTCNRTLLNFESLVKLTSLVRFTMIKSTT